MALQRRSFEMGERPNQVRRDEQRLKEWQFLLLRFAVTREPIDQAAAASAAQPLDAAICRHEPSFSYFARTTSEVCAAIANSHDENAALTLRRFLSRIDDDRLRAAFAACLDLTDGAAARAAKPRAAWRDRQDLWRGLPKR